MKEKELQHYAIDGTKISINEKWLQDLINRKIEVEGIKGKGVLFSDQTLKKFIEEEYKHDKHIVLKDEKRSLRSYSSGEQKKVLLDYLLSQNPDFLVVDDPFDSLDIASVKMISERLIDLSKRIPIIQLFKRKSDILPFITKILNFENNEYKIEDLKDYLHRKAEIPSPLNQPIPPAIEHYEHIPDVLIELKNVSVIYDRPVLKDINWKVKKGEFWQLIGPNGSGKTTILSMVFGNNTKGYGEDLYLFGSKKGSGESVWDIKQKIGYFSPSLTELFKGSHSVEEMIISGLLDSVGLYQKPRNKHKILADKWLKVIGLDSNKNIRFLRLSPVERRLILIARAMIKHPPLLILDEPTTSLDDEGSQLVVQLINKIAEESSTAILYVSHRKEEQLNPQFIYELTPTENGSKGQQIK
tara:strand:+ start:24 stop:1262 length:1239 start_codon:yes stop_codon:yes gene_type:complete